MNFEEWSKQRYGILITGFGQVAWEEATKQERERCARIAEQVRDTPKVRDGRPDECTQIAILIRKGGGTDEI